MNNRPSLYRSTLVAAAVAIGCCGAATTQAYEPGGRGIDSGRSGDRGYGPRYADRPGAWLGDAVGARPAAAPVGVGTGSAAVVIRWPL